METIIGVKFYYHTPAEARSSLSSIRAFFREGVEAYNFWRQHNDTKKKESFWQRFARKFPLTAGYLETLHNEHGQPVFGSDLHHVGGTIGFGDMADLDIDLIAKGCVVQIKTQADALLDRDSLFEYTVKRFGALRQSNKEFEEYTVALPPLARMCIPRKGGEDRAFHTNV